MIRTRFSPALRIATITALLAVLAPAIIWAIYVNPTAVFMDPRTRDASVTIGNSGESPEEATIELKFGFPDADSAGTPYIRFVEDPGPEFASAAAWIRPFPQRVRLEPGTQQIVRLLARPPADLPDGEYWTRMIISGRGASVSLPTADSTVRVGVGLEIRLVTSVSYRKGRVTTSVALRSLSAELDGDSISVWTNMAREGNAAWLGTADIELATARGTIVQRWAIPLSVYYPVRRRFAYPTGRLEPGDYKVRFRLRAERPDLPADRVLPAATVMDSVSVRVF
jgi:hypothetical protein